MIRFKSVLPEPYVVVATPAFLKRHAIHNKEDLLLAPHLRFNRDPAVNLLELGGGLVNTVASFNDLGSVRSGCCAGIGWARLSNRSATPEHYFRCHFFDQ